MSLRGLNVPEDLTRFVLAQGAPTQLRYRKSGAAETLFACVSPPGSVFERLLEKYFRGERDAETFRLLGVAVARG